MSRASWIIVAALLALTVLVVLFGGLFTDASQPGTSDSDDFWVLIIFVILLLPDPVTKKKPRY